jgi:hypothetical protein
MSYSNSSYASGPWWLGIRQGSAPLGTQEHRQRAGSTRTSDHGEHRRRAPSLCSTDINVASFNGLKQRMIEIGAQDLDDPEPEHKPAGKSKKGLEELLVRPVRPARPPNKPAAVATGQLLS